MISSFQMLRLTTFGLEIIMDNNNDTVLIDLRSTWIMIGWWSLDYNQCCFNHSYEHDLWYGFKNELPKFLFRSVKKITTGFLLL